LKDKALSDRTIQAVVHFSAPFVLRGLDGVHPAGDYDVDHDEQLIDGMSWQAWRRVATYIHLPARAANGPIAQLLAIDPADLDCALRRDQENAQ
jgi:hypothetical protein